MSGDRSPGPLALLLCDAGVRSRLSAVLTLAGVIVRVAPSLDAIDDTMLVVTDRLPEAFAPGAAPMCGPVSVCAFTRDAAGAIRIDRRICVGATSAAEVLRAALALDGFVEQPGVEGDP